MDGKWRGRIGQEVLYVGIIEEEGKRERERGKIDTKKWNERRWVEKATTTTTMMMMIGEGEKIVSKRNRRASRQCFGLILSARRLLFPAFRPGRYRVKIVTRFHFGTSPPF